ncbi:SusD-like starch-binding protein associating with outer membrane [Mucilaginibacter yixingensis]|uniref:SusD-like starch-binding protein associating with outer membrane n=1 Tax=Mucilaginibacter yixingensis TaxID=1295612 RepID=A0A2T5J6Q8_9SPHI|nr:RagB/SusD family nutrient uptake outer membrane protein [Mucilaginibacter yixingensis]PTQ94179.1 SusD-like starch-binding protein associating with outer membrane [Mucilaginibacter yixingensis]
MGSNIECSGFYAYQSKCTTPGGHPSNLIMNASTGLLKSTAGATYLDQYMFRLAETYLICAEAYMDLNNLNSVAADINTVRARSNASAVVASAINMDYILDERMRELGVEEKRALTLMRLGLLYDRVKRFNTYYNDINQKFNLWRIPVSEPVLSLPLPTTV